MNANGTGIKVTERDAEGTVTFDMSPELYVSYVRTLTVNARDIDDQTIGNTRWTSFLDERRGLVSLTAVGENAAPEPTTPVCDRCHGEIGTECNRDCTCTHCHRHACSGECSPNSALSQSHEPTTPEEGATWYTAEACWNIFSDKPHVTPTYNAVDIAWGDDLAQVERDARARIRSRDLHPHVVNINAHTSRSGRYLRKVSTLALAALAFLAVTSSALADHTQCYQSGTTGEGFPVISCPEEGATYYIDMDGTDGTLGTEGDGRWIEIR
jgi:hypothetical protein